MCIISELLNSESGHQSILNILHLHSVTAVSIASLSTGWMNELIPSVSSTLGRGLGGGGGGENVFSVLKEQSRISNLGCR